MGEIGFLFNQIFTYPIYNGLVILYHLFGDFALSIVVLTLIIKLVLFPLTLQQLKSMKANQALQPQMQEIRKKYANDQQAQMQAMQALYKEYGVNPMAGCLPLVVQLPVLYGLYYALSAGVRTDKLSDINAPLYSFVPHFTTMPDLSFRWFSWLSFLNPLLHVNWNWAFPLNHADPTHVLPILAGLATFVSLKMSQPRTTPVTENKSKAGALDPSTQTMKTMQYIMPLFTVFIGWSFPAGLALYWTVSSIFQAVQQYFVTGWGSLFTTPNMKPVAATASSSNSSTTTSRSQTRRVVESTASAVSKEEDGNGGEEDGAVEPKLRTTTPRPGVNGSSQYSKRQRGGSASARRRSSNNASKSRR